LWNGEAGSVVGNLSEARSTHRLELKGDSMRKIAAQRAQLDLANKT
jgi:hypothetical protein